MSASCLRTAGALLRATVVLSCVAALLLACVVARAAVAGASASTPAITLVSQSSWVASGGSFTVTVRRRADVSVAGLGVGLTVFNRLTSAYAFQRALTDPASGGVLDRTASVPLTGLAVPGQPREDRIAVPIASTSSSSGSALDLDCQDVCMGVYPVTVTVTDLGTGARIGRLTTFLTYQPSAASLSPLHTALVLPVAVATSFTSGPGRLPVGNAWVAGAQLGAACDLVRAIARSRVPVTVEVEPFTVQAMDEYCQTTAGSGARAAASGARVVQTLAGMSADPSFEIPSQSFVVTDPTALASAGLTKEVGVQMARGEEVLSNDRIATDPGSWVLTGAPVGSLRSGLAAAHVDQLVVPEKDVVSPLLKTTLTQPFHVDLGHGSSALVAGSNEMVGSLFEADPGDPALAAAQMLSGLEFIQSEAPYASSARGVVVVPPASWTPNATLVSDLLADMVGNPTTVTETLGHFFATVPVGANNFASTRQLSDSGAGISSSSAKAVRTGRARLVAFSSAVLRAPTVVTALDGDLLTAESSALGPDQRSTGIAAFDRALSAQVEQIRFSNDHTITLTSRRGSLPVTIESTAPYAVTGQLTVTSDKLEFPTGGTWDVTINHTTNEIRVPVFARTLGDLPMQVTFTSPGGGLVIAQSHITVRSTATSFVGILLTVLAAIVLAGWWLRTWLRGRRRKAVG